MNKRVLKHSFSLLHVDHVKLSVKWNYPNVLSPYYRIYFIDDGEGYIQDGKKKITLEPGYLYIIPSFTLCNLRCESFLSQYFIHFFEEFAETTSLFEQNRKVIKIPARDVDVENIRQLLKINPGRGINRSSNPKDYEKKDFYIHYEELNEKVSDAVYLESQGILLQLISRFMHSNEFTASNVSSSPSKILEAISYIHVNLKENLTVHTIAKEVNLHHDYFSRLFLQFTGERPLNYIHNKRIQRAQYLIATTDLSYNSIAEETGFENTPYFCRIFKKITKVTPGEYKKLNNASLTSR